MTDADEHEERREYKRFKVKEGVFAVRNGSGWQLAGVVDINQKGMGIRLPSESSLFNQYDFFDLFSCHVEGVVKYLPGSIVSHQTGDTPGSDRASAIARCGVKFFEISPSAQRLLELFINQHALEQE